MKENNYNEDVLDDVEVSDEEWQKGFEDFMKKYPDCPMAEPIECLDLIMKREWAEKILQGTKKIEFRDFSEHYAKRLCDKKVMDYIDAHMDDEDFMVEVGNYVSSLRPVQKIHFHNYNNTWFLDVSVRVNEVISCHKEEVEFLQEEFNSHELDEEYEYYSKHKKEEMPEWFYFVIEDVLDTNLEG